MPTDADAPTSTSGVGTGGENHEPEAPTPIGSEIGDPSARPDTPGGSDTPGGATDDDSVQPGKEAKRHGAGSYVEVRDLEHQYYRDGDRDGVVCE